MTEQLVIRRRDESSDSKRLNWARIIGIAFVIALHAAALLLLLVPAVAPKVEAQTQPRVVVNLVEAKPPPPPPPPPPPKPVEQPKPPVRNLAPPRTTTQPVTPPPDPPITVDTPRDIDIVSTPVPPPPPPPPQEIAASVDISSRQMNPPSYPPAALREGIEGQIVLIIDVDASGNITNIVVEKNTSPGRNRDLERAAIAAARKWKLNPATVNGQPVAGRARVPLDFKIDR